MDPYRVFFPLGLVLGGLGTLLWVVFGFGWATAYPGQIHADLMMGGFLFSFASGFLMTALPRFTGAPATRSWELLVNFILIGSLPVWSFLALRSVFYWASFASMVFLVIYAGRRFKVRAFEPPASFVFVGLGLFSGVLGALLLAMASTPIADSHFLGVGRILYYHGMMISLVLGIGTQLLPALLGHQEFAPTRVARVARSEALKIKEAGKLFRGASPSYGLLLAATLALGLLLEALWDAKIGRLLRAGVLSVVALGSWRLYRLPAARSHLAYCLWLSAWSLLAGTWAPVLFPAFAIHGVHLAFIGGFGLMTLMVASRVTLAHGGHGLKLEKNSWLIAATGILILVSALTRLSAGFLPRSYLHHLAYAAVTWAVALGAWGFVFVPKMLLTAGNENSDRDP